MELYIEKEFLDNFSIEYDEANPSRAQKVLASIFKEYGDVEWFMDTEINTSEEFEELAMSYYFLATRSDYKGPTEVTSIKDELFENSGFQQTLVLTASEQEWFKEAEQMGALCFSYDNYEQKISKIIDLCHFKIDLSDQFPGWELFSNLAEIPFTEILLSDNYILTNQPNQLMDRNIIPLLKKLLNSKRTQNIKLKVFTKEFNIDQKEYDYLIEGTLQKRLEKLNSGLANFKTSVKIINSISPQKTIIFHDRVLFTDFFTIDSGVGFNLSNSRISNSQILVETIFNKYTYKRVSNLKRLCKRHENELKKEKNQLFTIYPS